jgi:prepilin-type N-terminal cleavage/methylation domain-containing protein
MSNKQKGMTLAEVLVATAILAVLVFATMSVTSAALSGSKNNMDRQFATQKAISMLEELKALVQVNTGTSITVIDDYNDAGAYRNRLTTLGSDPNATPGDTLSGNVAKGSGWLYSRQVSVKPLTDQSDPTLVISSTDVRMVRVRVFKNLPNGGRQLLAEVASIVRTLAVSFPPSQVYDVYCVAIENVPGWWVNMSTLVTFAQNALGDLQTRHPGLVFRQRMITKLAYGRDTQYRPYINVGVDSKADVPSVYFYPGLLPPSYQDPGGTTLYSAAQYYYPPANIGGQFTDDDAVVQNGYSATLNPYPYALADQYNHAMRYQDEWNLYVQRRDARDADGDLIYPDEQPTLRILLDQMEARPWDYQNAIVINLHGELLPFPPVRNYSDAAKKPDFYRGATAATPNGVRVVTHPEQIAYNVDNTTEAASTVNLRVYSYLTHPDNAIKKFVGGSLVNLNTATVKAEWLPEPITIVLKNLNWTPTASAIRAITGGVDFNQDGTRDSYSESAADVTDVASPSARMYFTTTTVIKAAGLTDTLIKLYNSPLVSPCAPNADCSSSGGIRHVNTNDTTRRLYGMEYIPSPLENFALAGVQTPFATNLVSQGDKQKNTARWIIQIPTTTFGTGRQLEIETRIGNYNFDSTTQQYVSTLSPAYTEPPDLSRTYVWRGNVDYLLGDPAANPQVPAALPISERYQFEGDPRHCPYADLKKPHTTAGNAVTFHTGNVNPYYGQGYDRYFDGFRETQGGVTAVNKRSDWPGWVYQVSGGTSYGVKDNDNALWNGMDIDIPRVFQVWRTALMKTNSLFTTMTGYPFYYLGTGNEIGYDTANGFPSSIPLSRLPFDPTLPVATRQFENSITGNGVRYIQEGDSTWWGMSWIGELYPDARYDVSGSSDDWKGKGNLNTGTALASGAGTFRRVWRSNVIANTPASRTHTPGTTLQSADHNTASQGIAMFYGSASSSTVKPDCCTDNDPADYGSLDATAAPGGGGDEIKNNYNFPLDSPMPAWRPFLITGTANGNPEGLGQAPYGTTTTTLSWLRKYYDQNAQATHSSSAALGVREGSTQKAMFVVANGLSPTGAAGTEFLARWAFLSLIQSFFEAGRFNGGAAPAVTQLPRVSITDPNLNTDIPPASTSVTINWSLSWKRWDGKSYTTAYASNFSETSAMSYYVMYSSDNGVTWKYPQNGAVATPGVRSADPVNHKITALTYDWPIPLNTFPTGAYIIRVEAYRDNYPLHYAYHQYQMFLNR